MNTRKVVAVGMIVLGLLIIGVTLFADGDRETGRFIFIAAGAVITGSGSIMLRRQRKNRSQARFN